MRKVLFTILVFVGAYANAQFIEFGGGPGIMNYSGDLVRGYSFSTTTLAGSVYYRMNFSEIVTLRLAATIGKAKGSETPIDAFATQRDHSFSNSILEFSSIFEYHFFDFKSQKSRRDWSPYVFGGFGVMSVGDIPANSNVGKVQPVLPVGFGFKYLVAKKYSIGFEAGARKTFYDHLDGISDGDQTIKDYQYGNPKDDDWYFYSGISFSIILFNIPCPFPYIPNNSLLSR